VFLIIFKIASDDEGHKTHKVSRGTNARVYTTSTLRGCTKSTVLQRSGKRSERGRVPESGQGNFGSFVECRPASYCRVRVTLRRSSTALLMAAVLVVEVVKVAGG